MVGPEVASSIRSFFESPANQHMLAGLREAGLWPVAAAEPVEAAGEGGPLQGKNILFTGTLSMARGKAKQLHDGRRRSAGQREQKTGYPCGGRKSRQQTGKSPKPGDHRP